jgi:Holliday junction resolvase
VAKNTTRQGAAFELKVMHALEEHGYTCLRSSGSRGAVDVVAVGPAKPFNDHAWIRTPLLFIQCKITNPVIPPYERNAVQELATRAGAVPLVAHWAKDPETKLMRVHYRLLTGPGPKDWAHWAPGEDS